jgi:hypothetical protein
MKRMRLVTIIIGFAIWIAPGFSQSPFSATYDSARQVKLQGSITRIDWVTPAAFIFVDVRDATGTVANWAVEIGNPIELERDGWKRNSLHIGETVTIDGIPARTEARQASAKSVTRMGKRLFGPPNRRPAAAATPAPRWPDGQVRLGPAPGKTGYWALPSTKVVVDSTGSKVPMSEDGLLTNISDADKVAPFLPWAKAIFENRQRRFLKDDPYSKCVPPGGPRQFQMANGFQFVEQKELGRILVLLGGGDRNWRVIYTDKRPLGTAAEAVPSYYGVSVGRWDKDTLVVESVGYNEKFWMTSAGLPHTEALHLTEKFTRTDMNTLKYEVTVDDPRTYTKPWTTGWTVQWVGDQDIQEYFCEDNSDFVR